MTAPRILAIRRRYLGDVVLMGSTLRSLRRHWPQCHLTVLVEPAFAPILELNPDVDKTFTMPRGARGWLATVFKLRQARFTHTLDFDNRRQTAILTRLTSAACRIALHHGPLVRLPRFYTQHEIVEPEFLDHRHITDYYHRMLRPLSVPVDPEPPQLVPRQADLDFVRQLPGFSSGSSHSQRLLIHPGSRSPHRIWPATRFAEVIALLNSHGVTPILVAGPGEQAVVQEIQSHLAQPAITIAQKLTIPQLGALFASASALLCHDSGPMHLAAAVGTKVVALFSSQNVATWRPLGKGHITLQAPMPCNPCLSPGFCVPSDSYHNHCVRHLSVDQVCAAVLQQIRSSQSSASR